MPSLKVVKEQNKWKIKNNVQFQLISRDLSVFFFFKGVFCYTILSQKVFFLIVCATDCAEHQLLSSS